MIALLLFAADAASAPLPVEPAAHVAPLPLDWSLERKAEPGTPQPVALHARVQRVDWSDFERGRCSEARLGAEWRARHRLALSAAVRTRRGSSLARDDAGAVAALRLSF